MDYDVGCVGGELQRDIDEPCPAISRAVPADARWYLTGVPAIVIEPGGSSLLCAMVPMSRHTPRYEVALRPEAIKRLRSVLLAGWRAPPQLYDEFRETIAAVAQEARQLGCQPERLLILVKAIEREEQLVPFDMSGDGVTRSEFHDWLLRVTLESYYGRARSPRGEGRAPRAAFW